MKIETQVQIVITLTEDEARQVLTDPEEMQDIIRSKLNGGERSALLQSPKENGASHRNFRRERCPKCGKMVIAHYLEKGNHRCTALDVK